MEIILELDDDFMKILSDRTGFTDPAEIIQESLGAFDWMTGEVMKYRAIVSIGENGSSPNRLMTPGLKAVEERRG